MILSASIKGDILTVSIQLEAPRLSKRGLCQIIGGTGGFSSLPVTWRGQPVSLGPHSVLIPVAAGAEATAQRTPARRGRRTGGGR